jgi:hypothetical protein
MMNTLNHWKCLTGIGLLAGSVALAAPAEQVEPPVPVTRQAGPEPVMEPTPAGQRLYQAGRNLVPPEQAQAVVERFRAAYEALGSPRLVIAVNREVVDRSGDLRVTTSEQRVSETTTTSKSSYGAPRDGGTVATQVNIAVNGAAGAANGPTATGPGEGSATSRTVTAQNMFTAGERAAATLADRQTTRDVERLFGRPFRIGGARLADQRVVAALLAARPLDDVIAASNEPARRDREALAKVADGVIEVLISSRAITIPGFNGGEARVVPDIQATLIRLADGAILGQASARDVLGKDREAGPRVRNYDVSDIAEATALALMEDITVTAPVVAR